MKNIIIVKNVRKGFGAKVVLKGIDLAVRENEILAIMGPNGAGKTTFLLTLCGALLPDKGKISIFGANPRSSEVKKRLSLLLQEALAQEYLTGNENIQFYSKLHSAPTRHWRRLVKMLEMESDIHRVVKTYSGGMKRKLELILSLSVDVPLYLLDEPTLELDLSTTQKIHDFLLKLKHNGKTIILNTHNPLDAEISDRIAFMVGGQIKIMAAPSALLKQIPLVIRFTSAARINNIVRKHVLNNQIFERGGEGGAFLPSQLAKRRIRQIRSLANKIDPRCKVQIEDPTYTDMFNYFVYVRGK